MIMTRGDSNCFKGLRHVLLLLLLCVNSGQAWTCRTDGGFHQQSLDCRNPHAKTLLPLQLQVSEWQEENHDGSSSGISSSARRMLILQTLAAYMSMSSSVSAAQEASSTSTAEEGGIMAAVALFLQEVPTYCIVDDAGVPFMVVGEDAIVTGYFFTTFSEAQRLLSLASQSADRSIRESRKDPLQPKEDVLLNPWKSARISTVPLATAAAIVTKSITRQLGRSNVFLLAPAESDVEDALAITEQKELQEGKVPLFYMQNFSIPVETVKSGDADTTSVMKQPLYFTKSQLLQAHARLGNKEPVVVEVTELLSVLRAMADDSSLLDTLVLVPPPGSVKKAQQLNKDKRPAFLLGQRNLIL